jgi:hypothetical protein
MEEVVIHHPEPPIGTLEQIHIGFASHILGEDDGQFWARRIGRTASGEGRAEWRDAMRFGEDRVIGRIAADRPARTS